MNEQPGKKEDHDDHLGESETQRSESEAPLLLLLLKVSTCGAAKGNLVGGWTPDPSREMTPADEMEELLFCKGKMGERR